MDNSRLDNIIRAFHEKYEAVPMAFRAPGRVNLIGEHTDYNEGFVMPFAIDRETITAGAARTDRIINAVALDMSETARIDLDAAPVMRRGNWVDYVEGTARSLYDAFGPIKGADLVFSSNVPIGSGLSSSAALEVSVGFALLSLNNVNIGRKKLAFAAQLAEHEYVGIRSGIMDQFTSVFGQNGHAMLLDCRSLEIRQIKLAIKDTRVAVCDTGVKHELASTEYNRRREECDEGVRLLAEKLPGIRSLRDVTEADLDRYGCDLPETVARRCRHVVSEDRRTVAAARALVAGRAGEVGQLMFDSHRSLRDDYEVSCPELDELVAAASDVEGVYGARMTGGGFGGCTVNLLAYGCFDEFAAKVTGRYQRRFGKKPEIYEFAAVDGASEVDM